MESNDYKQHLTQKELTNQKRLLGKIDAVKLNTELIYLDFHAQVTSESYSLK